MTKDTIQNPSQTWPREFLAEFERIGVAIWLFIYLLTRMNPRTRYVRARFQHISEELGVSTIDLKNWLEQLEQEGYLKDESLNSKMIVYIIL